MEKIAAEGLAGPLRDALSLKREAGAAGQASGHLLARGNGWSFYDVLCSCGPEDRGFEERHGETSVSFVVAGAFVYRSNGGRSALPTGAVLLGNSDACFECRHDHGEGDRCLSFHYQPALVEEVASQLRAKPRFERTSLPPLRAFSRLFAQCARALHAPRDLDALALESLGQSLSRSNDVESRNPVRPQDERRVLEVARYLEMNHAEPISLTQLADLAGLSRFRLLHLYKQVIGSTPHQHVLRLRLRSAALKLVATNMPVTEIAYAVGFEDLSNFVRSFGREFGTSPSRFRRGARGGH